MERLFIIKVGGAIIEDQQKMYEFLDGFTRVNAKKILVHGGGRSATGLAEKLHVVAKWHNGRRITDAEMLDIVVMTYAGRINKKIVCYLQSLDTNAIGLTGADADLITSDIRKKQPVDFGWVGDPVSVNTEILRNFIETDLTPVIAPITHDKKGNLLNTNADTITSAIGIAMSTYYDTECVYCFELDGVMEDVNDPDSLIDQINTTRFQSLQAEGKIVDGMVPKLESAFLSIQNGVKAVRIFPYKKVAHIMNDKNKVGTLIIK